ncbi:fimbria/pilus outer membrane usher protein [Enterobacter kobei]|uniref:fimbria/pilus outer membrane usher protein n=1 Tax=Enterobacter TaxID=547 RepID=UPI0007ADF150|nr:fimbrial protein [Enterobacter sp. ODB01]
MATAHDISNNTPQSAIVSDSQPLIGSDLYLDVTLNGNPVGLIHFSYADGKLYGSANTLRQLGLRLPKGMTSPVSLDSFMQLKVSYNARQQTLELHTPLEMLDITTTQINEFNETGPKSDISSGALLNYELYTQQGNDSSVNTFSELRAFNTEGVLSTNQLSQFSKVKEHGNQFARLDTSWRSSFPDKMLAVTLGDTLTSSLSWSRPTRIAGIQVGTDFSLKPYMPTTPLPSFLGSATLPSSVELYVNGMKTYNGQVPAGNFQINTMPSISGAGNARMVMTDALGRTTVQNFSFYNDQQLLGKGLTSWSAELGVVRENYGFSSFDYTGTPALSATWRRGISNALTTGAHAEARSNLVNSGVDSNWIPSARSGTLSTSFAMSTDAGENGFQYGMGYRWSGEKFNFGTSTVGTSGKYHDVATYYGLPPPELNSSTVAGYNFGTAGNLSLSYLQLRYPKKSAVRYASASWFKTLTDYVFINAGFNQNVNDSRDSSIYLMLTVSASDNISVSSTVQRTNNETGYQLNASRTPPSDGGIGWNVAASQQGSEQNGQGEVGYLGRYGKVYTGFNSVPHNQYSYSGITGAVVMMGGGLFAARQINSGFAVVSTDGIPDVPIKLQNNLVGVSDAQGLLLVSQLNSYQKNEISIDPMKLPANMRITRVIANATPADRSGTLVNFGIIPVHAALVILVDDNGRVIPQGSTATLSGGTRQSSEVGFEGMAYFDTLEPHNRLHVSTVNGDCYVRFSYPKNTKDIARIGPLICR